MEPAEDLPSRTQLDSAGVILGELDDYSAATSILATSSTTFDIVTNDVDARVVLLLFRRFDNFKSLLMESEQLRPCREALAMHNFNPELSQHGLGGGKMFVCPELAIDTIVELRMKEVVDGRRLLAGHIAVSTEYEQVVMDVIRDGAKRVNHVMFREVLVV